jgi:hypothetical protein
LGATWTLFDVLVGSSTVMKCAKAASETGVELKDVPVGYKTWGKLNEAGDNCFRVLQLPEPILTLTVKIVAAVVFLKMSASNRQKSQSFCPTAENCKTTIRLARSAPHETEADGTRCGVVEMTVRPR